MVTLKAVVPAMPIELPHELERDFSEMDFPALAETLSNKITEYEYGYLDGKLEKIAILAWYRDKDDRPLFIDCALCWAKLTTTEGMKWLLVHMVRNPYELRCEWATCLVCDYEGPYSGFSVYDRPPTNEDVRKTFGFFEFTPDTDVCRYASFLDRMAWMAALGEIPEK